MEEEEKERCIEEIRNLFFCSFGPKQNKKSRKNADIVAFTGIAQQ
jgi:hypothetical protein